MTPRPWHPVLLSVALGACGPSAPGDDSGGEDSGSPGELWPAEGCLEDDAHFGAVSAEVTAIPSVLRVRWEGPEGGTVRAIFAAQGEEAAPLESAEVPGSDRALLLLGLPHDAEASYRLVAREGEDVVCSAAHQATTDPLPTSFPALTSALSDTEAVTTPWAVVTLWQMDSSWVTILDGRGRPVWIWEASWGAIRARLSHDRQAVLVDAMPTASSDMGIRRVALDGSTSSTTTVEAIGVDWLELPDGSYAAIVNEIRELELDGESRSILGQGIVEVQPGGAQRSVWSVFDLREPDLSVRYEESTSTAGSPAEDWAHLNGLSYYEPLDLYLITSQNFDSVIAVDRGRGAALWELSRDSADWTNISGGTLVSSPHGAEMVADDRLQIFNRWSDRHLGSEVAEVRLHQDSGEAELVWSASADNDPNVNQFGNAERLASGNTLVSWSSAGQLDELTPEGASALRLELGLEHIFGFVSAAEDLYGD
jgi:hypothetical protein